MGDEGIAGVLSFIGVKVNTIINPLYSGKNRDIPYYKEKALQTCVLEQKYLSTNRLLGTTR
jgi:hypothetical protein